MVLASLYLFPQACAMATDIAHVAGVTFFFLAVVILRTDARARRFVALSLATGFALLAKQFAPLFFAVPLLWLLVESRARRLRHVAFVSTLVVSLAAGAGIAVLVFYGDLDWAWFLDSLERRSLHGSSPIEPWYLDVLFYPGLLLAWPLAALVPFLALSLKRSRGPECRDQLWVLAGVLFPAVSLTAFPTKFSHYLLPAVPAWIALLARGVCEPPLSRSGAVVRKCALFAAVGFLALEGVGEWDGHSTSFRSQIVLYQELARSIDWACEEGNAPAVASSLPLAPRSFANYLAWTGRLPCSLVDPPFSARPPRLVVLRRGFTDVPGICLTDEEIHRWRRTSIPLARPQWEWAEQYIGDYVAERTFGAGETKIGGELLNRYGFSLCVLRDGQDRAELSAAPTHDRK